MELGHEEQGEQCLRRTELAQKLCFQRRPDAFFEELNIHQIKTLVIGCGEQGKQVENGIGRDR